MIRFRRAIGWKGKDLRIPKPDSDEQYATRLITRESPKNCMFCGGECHSAWVCVNKGTYSTRAPIARYFTFWHQYLFLSHLDSRIRSPSCMLKNIVLYLETSASDPQARLLHPALDRSPAYHSFVFRTLAILAPVRAFLSSKCRHSLMYCSIES